MKPWIVDFYRWNDAQYMGTIICEYVYLLHLLPFRIYIMPRKPYKPKA